MANYTKVTSVEHLGQLVDKGKTDFFICLNFGIRSSKFINRGDNNKFFICNLSDDSEQELTAEELMDKKFTNIGEAITKGAFYCEED